MSDAAKQVLAARDDADALQADTRLIAYLQSVEANIRDEIREQAKSAISELSSDIQLMWATLHPDCPIKDVGLYFNEAAPKAIDVCLQFYGIEQVSPRLTLSEGFRNSLGLCIFLAMAKHASTDNPLILDDVIISLDRQHRGMVAKVLLEHFGDRQVLLFTHDRDWFTDLTQQLDAKNWGYKSLLPYSGPEIGIRFSELTSTFDDARTNVDARPDIAAMEARKIMDIHLSLICEKLSVKLPHRRGVQNERRMSHEFLLAFITEGENALRIRSESGHVSFQEGLAQWKSTDALLVTWGNRGSHSPDVVRAEARDLIESCEKSLSYFQCAECFSNVWSSVTKGGLQCSCARIQWRH